MIILTFCNKNPPTEPLEITVHEQLFPLTLRKEREKMIDTFYFISFVQLHDLNNFIIHYFDKSTNMHEFIRMDSSLEIEGKYSLARGQGPREIGKIFFFGGTADEIFIYDGVNLRVMFCDKEFKNCKLTRKALHKDDYISGFGYSPDTGYFLMAEQFFSTSSKKFNAVFFLRDVKHGNGEDLPLHCIYYNKIERDLNGNTHIWIGMPFDAILIRNFAFIINLKDYTIFKYDLKGRLIKSIKVLFTGQNYSKSQMAEFKAAWGDNNSKMRAVMYPRELWPACWIQPLGKGFVVARRKDHMPSNGSLLDADYFDLDLNFLGKISFPAFADWNHPNYSWMAKSRDIFYNGRKLYIIRQADDKEVCIIEEWSLN